MQSRLRNRSPKSSQSIRIALTLIASSSSNRLSYSTVTYMQRSLFLKYLKIVSTGTVCVCVPLTMPLVCLLSSLVISNPLSFPLTSLETNFILFPPTPRYQGTHIEEPCAIYHIVTQTMGTKWMSLRKFLSKGFHCQCLQVVRLRPKQE